MGLLNDDDDDDSNQIGLSLSRAATPAVGVFNTLDLNNNDDDLPPTAMAPALIEEGHGHGGNGSRSLYGSGSEPAPAYVVDEKRGTSSEGTVVTATDELSSADSCECGGLVGLCFDGERRVGTICCT
jgi:hypothetical protein